MQRAYGLEIPQTLEEVCHPSRMALVVYDMQVGILSQLRDGDAILLEFAGDAILTDTATVCPLLHGGLGSR